MHLDASFDFKRQRWAITANNAVADLHEDTSGQRGLSYCAAESPECVGNKLSVFLTTRQAGDAKQCPTSTCRMRDSIAVPTGDNIEFSLSDWSELNVRQQQFGEESQQLTRSIPFVVDYIPTASHVCIAGHATESASQHHKSRTTGSLYHNCPPSQ